MADYSAKKYSNALKNPVIEGTDAMIVPKGTSAERVTSTVGALRYNIDNGVMEQYNATGWAGIDAPPVITNISGTINTDTNSTITVTGSNFKAGSLIAVEGAGVGGVARSVVTTFVNSTSLTFATNATSVNYTGGGAFNVRVTNPSGLSAVLENAGTIDRDPVWSTGAGTIATWGSGASRSVTVTATDPDSNTIAYSVVSGSLPGGVTLDSATGVISGTVSIVTSQTTYTFTVRATANGQTADRIFNIIANPIGSGGTESTVNIGGTNYRLHAFTSTGANTFTLNTDATVAVLIVAGGGAGGSGYGDQDTGKGGGGAGQVLVRTGYAITAGSYPLTVGAGKAGRTNGTNSVPPAPGTGGNSVGFGVTANGGGDGGGSDNYTGPPAQGGSGGGAGCRNNDGSYNVGASSNKTTPASWTSYGNSGGSTGNGNFGGGGGGGAGGSGSNGQQNQNNSLGGDGGAGVDLSATFGTTYGVSGVFGGGGGGGCYTTSTLLAQSNGGSGGGGKGNSGKESSVNPSPQNSAVNIDGVANTGGGGGGASEDGQDSNGNNAGGGSASGSGGSGIIIVRYAI